MRNLRLKICYDGTRYRGWQRLANTDNTIQGKLETTLSRILGEEIEVSGSGRTDAGAHAEGQIANFHCHCQMPAQEIMLQLRRYLPEDIGIYSCTEASERFHARLNAREKTYRYRVWNSEDPCVFDRRFVHVDTRNLDLDKMRQGASVLVGEHDFSAFCANKKMKKSTVRTVYSIDIRQSGNEIQFTFRGNGFLYNMVRIMVGTLLEIGAGDRDAQTFPSLFGAKREAAGPLVPACGLCLMEVSY